MEKSFNNLSPAELERLALVAEECAEVQQIIMKIIRHGYESYHPNDLDKITNRILLTKELGDLVFCIGLMVAYEDVDHASVEEAIDEKSSRVWKYLHHNPKT